MLSNEHLIGKHFLKIKECASTNTLALDFLKQSKEVNGWVFVTEEQTKGRGQKGNTWESESRQNLTFSFVIKPSFLLVHQQFALNFFVSLGIYDFLSKKVPEANIKVKWPNDIYVNNQKIAGILIENIVKSNCIDASVMGVGININQVFFQSVEAQSLRKLTLQKYDLELCLRELVQCINIRYQELIELGFKQSKRKYLEHLHWLNESHLFFDVTQDGFFEGKIIGVDDFGQLIIQTTQGQRAFGLKEVQFVR
ncbi:MAG: biotin--[acetyl-CoA-carboxylase] ligase [Cytophagales bacterium]|nr:biotin--[acetyl-CoA-carboxylase] ligase [Cytophagales bacterium]